MLTPLDEYRLRFTRKEKVLDEFIGGRQHFNLELTYTA